METIGTAPPATKTQRLPQIEPFGLDSFDLEVLVKRRASVYTNHIVKVAPNDRGKDLIAKLRRLHRQTRDRLRLRSVTQLFMMRRIAIGTARILDILPTAIEHQSCSQIVQITDSQRDDFLTQAVRKPTLLRTNANLGQLLRRHGALTISFVFDRTAAWLWTLITVAISLVAGIVYSIVAKDINTGLGIGTAVLAVLLAIQGLLIFLGART